MKRWPEKSLGEIASVQMGQSPPGNTYNSDSNGLPFFQGKAEFGEKFPTPVKWCSQPSRIAEVGDILLSVRAPVGPTNFAMQRCCIGRGLAAIRAFPEMADQHYIRYYLKRFVVEIANRGVGSTFTAINRSDIENLKLPVPPLAEQKWIVKLLDEADELRKLRARANQRAAELIPALFHEMFGEIGRNSYQWPTENLGKLVTIEATLVDPREEAYQNLPHIGPDRIERNNGRLLPSKTAKEDGLISMKFLFDERDVLYSKIRPNLRKVALPDGQGLCSADMYPIRPGSRLLREFLWAYLLTDHFTSRALDLSARANMPKLNRVQLASIDAPIPPLSLQKEFTKRVKEIHELQTNQAQSYRNLEGLFHSMLHQAFNGKPTEASIKVEIRKNKKLNPTDLHAGVLARIILAHENRPECLPTLGHVKG
ncbi:MAG: restriction endonuclease subunit S, partial [Ignavibacteriales bacterium]|nr:restriction endonuclease subunit S [Ignavibacteriales bacterium]